MIYFTRISTNIKCDEGGISRDLAFFSVFHENIKGISVKIVDSQNFSKKIMYFFYYSLYLLFVKNKTIFFHLTPFCTVFPLKLIIKLKCLRFFKRYLDFIGSKNRIILEVNDLPFEQSKDLELELYLGAEQYFDTIFSIKTFEYIYASEMMRKYAIKKYHLNREKTYVCINGGITLEKNNVSIEFERNKRNITFIYCGTLNKGRQIEWLLDIFTNTFRKDVELILCGINGEWIKNYNLPSYIKYLGNLVEEEAHKIVSQCDIGIVPYDDKKFYYNLCYPTKNSFYITAGIPFLCTKLNETELWFNNQEVAFFLSSSEWTKFINSISQTHIKSYKENVNTIKHNFEWNNLIENLFYELGIVN